MLKRFGTDGEIIVFDVDDLCGCMVSTWSGQYPEGKIELQFYNAPNIFIQGLCTDGIYDAVLEWIMTINA